MTGPAEIEVTAAARLAADGEVLLLDVREDGEWQAGHAPGALHVPLGALTPTIVPRDRPVVAVCRSGNRSGYATQLLASVGYDVRNLVGGMQEWAAAGLPVVRPGGPVGPSRASAS